MLVPKSGLGNHSSKIQTNPIELPYAPASSCPTGCRSRFGSFQARTLAALQLASRPPPQPRAAMSNWEQSQHRQRPAAASPVLAPVPLQNHGSLPARATSKKQESGNRSCQLGTQSHNRSSYQQLDTPPRLICARNTKTVLNRKLDNLFELFAKGWDKFSVI